MLSPQSAEGWEGEAMQKPTRMAEIYRLTSLWSQEKWIHLTSEPPLAQSTALKGSAIFRVKIPWTGTAERKLQKQYWTYEQWLMEMFLAARGTASQLGRSHTHLSSCCHTRNVFSSPFPLIKCLESFHHALKTHMQRKKTELTPKACPRRLEICLYFLKRLSKKIRGKNWPEETTLQ